MSQGGVRLPRWPWAGLWMALVAAALSGCAAPGVPTDGPAALVTESDESP